MNLSHRGADFIAQWEGFTSKPTHFSFDPAGIYTIGFGHTIGVGPSTPPITRADALELLKSDAKWAAEAVRRLVKVPLRQHEFNALCSFVYNLGEGSLASSTLLKRLNAGHRRRAAREFRKWVYADGVRLPGLVNRRAAERRLFLRGKYRI